MIEELLTVPEVAIRLRIGAPTVRRWINTGALEAITLPHKGKRCEYRIRKSVLDRLLGEVATTPERTQEQDESWFSSSEPFLVTRYESI